MNYRIIMDGIPRIVKTGAAVNLTDVYGELGAARAAVKKWIERDIAKLREARDMARKTREGDLPYEDVEQPSLDIPPAPSADAEPPRPPAWSQGTVGTSAPEATSRPLVGAGRVVDDRPDLPDLPGFLDRRPKKGP